jgi:hypothetical protein
MSTQCFLALKTVVDQLQGELTPGIRRRLQTYVLQNLPLAGLGDDQFHKLEHWLKGGIASSIGNLPADTAGAVLHYFEVGLNEYLGPQAASDLLQRSFGNAQQRLANVGINPVELLIPTTKTA